GNTRLTDTAHRLGRIAEDGHVDDRRRVAHQDRRVLAEGAVRELAVLELHFFAQHRAEGLDNATLDLVLDRFRVHREARIERHVELDDLQLTGLGVHFHLRDLRDVGVGIEAEREAEALPGRADARGPARGVDRRVHDRREARVVLQHGVAERHWIHARLLGEDVDGRLAREGVGGRAVDAPEVRRQRRDAVVQGGLCLGDIRVDLVDVRAPVGCRTGRDFGPFRIVAAGVGIVAPAGDGVVLVQAGRDLDPHGRAELPEHELFDPVPDQLHRATDALGDGCRLDLDLRHDLAAEGTARVHAVNDDLRLVSAEVLRDGCARGERVLGRHPDIHAVLTYIHDGRLRLDRGVAQVRQEVGVGLGAFDVRERGVRVTGRAFLVQRLAVVRGFLQHVEDRLGRDGGAGLGPARLDGLDRRLDLVLALGHDRREVAFVDRADDTRHGLRLGEVDAVERGIEGRRSHDLAVDHAFDFDVDAVDLLAGRLRGEVNAREGLTDDLVVGRILERDFLADLALG